MKIIHIKLISIFFFGLLLLHLSAACEEEKSSFQEAQKVKLDLLAQKFNSIMQKMDNLEKEIEKASKLLEDMQNWPERDEEQEDIQKNKIEGLKDELKELKKEVDKLGEESRTVKGKDKSKAFKLIEKNLIEEINRLTFFRDWLIKNGQILIAQVIDDNKNYLKDLLRRLREEFLSDD